MWPNNNKWSKLFDKKAASPPHMAYTMLKKCGCNVLSLVTFMNYYWQQSYNISVAVIDIKETPVGNV